MPVSRALPGNSRCSSESNRARRHRRPVGPPEALCFTLRSQYVTSDGTAPKRISITFASEVTPSVAALALW
jgi:hypothetical protein